MRRKAQSTIPHLQSIRPALPASQDPDLFADSPDANPGDCEITTRAWAKPEKTVELVAPKTKRAKPVDLNPIQARWFAKNGWTFARTEHKNAWSGKSEDLWTFGDYIAYRGDEVMIVQTCKRDAISTREKKARQAPELEGWLAGRDRSFQIHGWYQTGGKGSKWYAVVREVRPKGETK